MVFSFWFVQWLQGNGSFRRPCHCLLSNVCNIVHSGSNGSSPCNVQWHPWETLSLSTLAPSPPLRPHCHASHLPFIASAPLFSLRRVHALCILQCQDIMFLRHFPKKISELMSQGTNVGVLISRELMSLGELRSLGANVWGN